MVYAMRRHCDCGISAADRIVAGTGNHNCAGWNCMELLKLNVQEEKVGKKPPAEDDQEFDGIKLIGIRPRLFAGVKLLVRAVETPT